MTDRQALRDKVAREIVGIRYRECCPLEPSPQDRFRRMWPSAQTAALRRADAILDALIGEAGE